MWSRAGTSGGRSGWTWQGLPCASMWGGNGRWGWLTSLTSRRTNPPPPPPASGTPPPPRGHGAPPPPPESPAYGHPRGAGGAGGGAAAERGGARVGRAAAGGGVGGARDPRGGRQPRPRGPSVQGQRGQAGRRVAVDGRHQGAGPACHQGENSGARPGDVAQGKATGTCSTGRGGA